MKAMNNKADLGSHQSVVFLRELDSKAVFPLSPTFMYDCRISALMAVIQNFQIGCGCVFIMVK